MNKRQIIWIICIICIGILFYSAIWVSSDTTLSEKLTFSGVVLFIQSVFGITSYDSYK